MHETSPEVTANLIIKVSCKPITIKKSISFTIYKKQQLHVILVKMPTNYYASYSWTAKLKWPSNELAFTIGIFNEVDIVAVAG